MQKWITFLSGLLVAQLVLAVVINLSGEDYGAFEADEKLLVFDPVAVDGLRIEAEDNSLWLQKTAQGWQLPAAHDFPADSASVQRLLDKLAALEQGWPVATTDSATRRFKVAEAEFQTRITLLAGEATVAQLYLGTSPGFRKVHVRPAVATAVFAVTFNSWEASTELDDWIDKEILELDDNTLQRIEFPDLVVERQETGMQVQDLGEQEKTDTEAVRSLLNRLAGLRIQSLLGVEAEAEYRQDAPVLEIKLTPKEGEPMTYRISQPAEASYYVLKRSDLDYYFKLPEFSVQPLLETTREKLVQSEPEEPSAPIAKETQQDAEQQVAIPMHNLESTPDE
jgi:hypothetical protein